MSQTVITAAFEQWKAQEAAGGKPVVLDGFVLANVPGLDPDKPISDTEGMPPTAQIVYRQDVDKVGVVNNNAVVYSITMGSNVGTFDFNWIGLVNKASGTVAMIVHAPMQRKLKTEDGQQGNAINRSFLMEYDGAATETQINTPAQTWQIDFTARLAGMDEELRLANVDIYGAGAFFGDGYLVTKTGTQYAVSVGSGYVGGIRTTLGSVQNITVTTKPAKVWLDVTWQGTLTGQWHAITTISVSATELKDHTDANGFEHYVFAVASIDSSGAITDLRPKGSLANQLAEDSVLTVNNIKADGKRNVTVPMYGLGLGPVAKTDAYSNIAQFYRVNNVSANKPPAVTGNVSAGVICAPMDAAPSAGYWAIVGGNMAAYVGFSGAEAGGITWARIYTEKYLPPMYGLGPVGSSRALLADLLSPDKGYTGFTWSSASGDPNAPTFFPQGGTFGIQNQLWRNTDQYFALQTVWRNGRIGFRTMEANVPGVWNEFFHTGHLPTATQTGALPLDGGTMTGEIKSTSANALRLIQGGYGAILRMNANGLYFLQTNKDDPNGNYNANRSLTISNDTGAVTIGTPLTVNHGDFIRKDGINTYTDGGITYHQTNGVSLQGVGDQYVQSYALETVGQRFAMRWRIHSGGLDSWPEFRNDGSLYLAGNWPAITMSSGTTVHPDGNLQGPCWEGDYLSNWLLEKVHPVGAALPWPTENAPPGWILCNGASFDRNSFPRLGAVFTNGTLPDYRGAFLRGKDNGRGIDPNRNLGDIQWGQAPASCIKRGDWGNYAGLDRGITAMIGTDNDGYPSVSQETEAQRETRPVNISVNYIVRAA